MNNKLFTKSSSLPLLLCTALMMAPLGEASRALANTTVAQQANLVKSSVVDNQGEPVIGASVIIVGQNVTQGTVTDLVRTPVGDVSNVLGGQATFNDATPLVQVDGVERSIDHAAPEEIESITVLKDASATAVFGVRGANGVVLITTKRGAEGLCYKNASAGKATYIPVLQDDGTFLFKKRGENTAVNYDKLRTSCGRNWYFEASLNYNRSFGLHTVTGLLLYNQSKTYYPKTYTDIPYSSTCKSVVI